MPNPFAVLDEEAATAPLKASTPAVVEVKPKTATATTQQKSAANGNQQRGKQQQRGDSLKRAPRPTGSSVEQAGGDSADTKVSNHPVHHGPRRGQRGFRGRGRLFDRHSGARPDSERKVAKAWGEPGAEEAALTEDGAAVVAEKPNEETNEASPVVEEQEEQVKTLEEYLAEKASISKAKELPPPRKANEGEENSKWKNAVPLVREEEQELFPIKAKSSGIKKSKEVKMKQQLEIKQHFSEAAATSFSRRGGKQPQRQSRGGSRGGRSSVPNINDSSAFPILA